MNLLLLSSVLSRADGSKKYLTGITYCEFEKEKSLFATIILEQNLYQNRVLR
jgi:hypothetical protein